MADLNLKLGDGREKIYVNKELYGEDRVIYVNLTDINIFARANEAEQNTAKYLSELFPDAEEGEALEAVTAVAEGSDDAPRDVLAEYYDKIKSADRYIRDQIDYMFDMAGTADAVFGSTFATANVGGGRSYFAAFMDAIVPMLEKRFKEYQKKSEAKTDKYTKKYHN